MLLGTVVCDARLAPRNFRNDQGTSIDTYVDCTFAGLAGRKGSSPGSWGTCGCLRIPA